MGFKQAVVLDESTGISTGKMISQACHASLGAYKAASDKDRSEWEQKGQKKVVLSLGEESLEDLYRKAKRNKIPAYLVKDAGHTEVKPGTKTAVGIGPAEESKVDSITGQLKLIR